jgi:probable phosphoglycerate mutase
VGEVLRGRHFVLVLSSPLTRAVESCRLAGFGEVVELRDDLQEWDYGAYEGLTTPEIRRQRPDWSLWSDGAPGGESPEAVGARADRLLLEVHAARRDTLLFGHGHLLRVLAARCLGLEPADGRRFVLDAGTISVLGYERETPVLRLWNKPVV